MNIEIKFDTQRLDRAMEGLYDKIEAAKKNALMGIGQAVASRATMAFRTASFRPSPWAPRKPSKSDDGHPLLIKSGTLRQSIGWRLEGTDTVVVGTDRKYAPYHQHGTKHMPARPFLPVGSDGRLVPAMERKISKIVNDAVSDALATV